MDDQATSSTWMPRAATSVATSVCSFPGERRKCALTLGLVPVSVYRGSSRASVLQAWRDPVAPCLVRTTSPRSARGARARHTEPSGPRSPRARTHGWPRSPLPAPTLHDGPGCAGTAAPGVSVTVERGREEQRLAPRGRGVRRPAKGWQNPMSAERSASSTTATSTADRLMSPMLIDCSKPVRAGHG